VAAKYVSGHMYNALRDEMKTKPVDRAIHDAYIRIDNEFIENHTGDSSGTTAASVIIDHHNKVHHQCVVCTNTCLCNIEMVCSMGR
jgi:nanoRNase/pAp phosphatase (c-di-AMP/oligoRNAs hydrolase)